MNALKENFEKFILLIMAVLLLLFAWFLFSRVMAFSETFAGVRGEVEKRSDMEELDYSILEEAAAQTAEPAAWEQTGKLFASRPYLERQGELVDPLEGGTPLHPPVPNQWLLDHDLDILDRNILSRDTDKDKFTNLEEFNAGTNPTDPNSVPPYITKLRLAEIESESNYILFRSATDGTFQIELPGTNLRTQFLKVGDPIKGTPYKITAFEEKFVENPATGGRTNISELTIQHTETGNERKLVIEKVTNLADAFAVFQYLYDDSTLRVKENDTFSLPPEENITYKLLELTPSRAVVENQRNQETYEVPKLEEGQQAEQQTSSAPKS